MAFNGSEGEQINLQTAAAWTANYRQTGAVIRAHFFGRDILEDILEQDGCMGIRIYYALDDNGTRQLILVGANADEGDMYEGVVADIGGLCPPNCTSNASPLNG